MLFAHLCPIVNCDILAHLVDYRSGENMDRFTSRILGALLCLCSCFTADVCAQGNNIPAKDKKKIVFIGGPKSHGYGMHTHTASSKLLAKWLNEYVNDVQCVVYTDGWPENVDPLKDTDCLFIYCDGGGAHIAIPHLASLKKYVERGGNLIMFHYAIEVPVGEPGDFFLDALGGYYETFFTVTKGFVGEFKTIPVHPITRGIVPFSLPDEMYFNIRFRPELKGVTPLMSCVPPDYLREEEHGPISGNPTVSREKGKLEHIAWCVERPDGGRGFVYTGGHIHWNWAHPLFRKLILNAVAWTDGCEVPKNGIVVPNPTWEELLQNQVYEPNLSDDEIREWQKKIKAWSDEYK